MARPCLVLLSIASMVLLLVGCEDADGNDHDWWVEEVDVHGRQVTCVFWEDHAWKASGMSCDWEPK